MDILGVTNHITIPFVQSGSYPERVGNLVRPWWMVSRRFVVSARRLR